MLQASSRTLGRRAWWHSTRGHSPNLSAAAAAAAGGGGPAAGGLPSLGDAAEIPVFQNGELADLPKGAGVYAVYNLRGEIQYIGISRQVLAE